MPVWGRIDRVWPVMSDGRSFVWVDEIYGRFEFAVLYHQYHELWYVADSFLLRNPNPWAAEVNPAYGEIERVGYSTNGRRDLLLIVEGSEQYHWWLLYLRVDDGWVISREFQLELVGASEGSEEDLPEESSDYSVDEHGSL